MAHRCLSEGAWVEEQRRHAFLPPRRVVPVDEIAKRVQREVLDEREADREAARLDTRASP